MICTIFKRRYFSSIRSFRLPKVHLIKSIKINLLVALCDYWGEITCSSAMCVHSMGIYNNCLRWLSILNCIIMQWIVLVLEFPTGWKFLFENYSWWIRILLDLQYLLPVGRSLIFRNWLEFFFVASERFIFLVPSLLSELYLLFFHAIYFFYGVIIIT